LKRKALLCLMLALLLLTTGCSDMVSFESQSMELVQLPNPEYDGYEAPWGDSQTDFLEQADVYYINENAQMLTQSTMTFMLSHDKDKITTVLEKLLSDTPDEMNPIAPAGTRLLGIEVTRDIVTVNLSLEARNADSDQELLWMYAAIANTILGMDDINGVNLLVNGRQEAIDGLPVGVMGRNDGDLGTLWAQQQADAERVETLPNSSLTRTAMLYFPSQDGNWYIAETKEITFVGGNYATALLAALSQEPAEVHGRPVLNAVNALASTPHTEISGNGKRYLSICFTDEIRQMMENAEVNEYQLAGMIALTMTGFIPELDGVKIVIGNTTILEVSDGEEKKTFANGLIRRSDYEDHIGDVITLYFASESGSLVMEEKVVSPMISRSPRTLLVQLMEGSDAYGEVIPSEASGDDILGVRIDNGVAFLNLSANFYRLCQNLSQEEERNLVYAIVNTMTELSNVNRVRFYFEGRSAETLTNSIYLNTMLLRNPGLVENYRDN